jgi:hypothetical protein
MTHFGDARQHLRLGGDRHDARHLIANSAKLGNLSDDYRDYVAANDGRIRHLIYYENEGVGIGKVVTSGSANPGLAGAERVPIGRNHINICKMAARTDQV